MGDNIYCAKCGAMHYCPSAISTPPSSQTFVIYDEMTHRLLEAIASQLAKLQPCVFHSEKGEPNANPAAGTS